MPRTISATEEQDCVHYWAIQPADGPISSGNCQVCGETREFKNYVESATWGDSRTVDKGASEPGVSGSTSDDGDGDSGEEVTDDPNPVDEDPSC